VSDERSEEQARSVFGNLPASRPGSRSPRRAAGSAGAAPDPTTDPPVEPDSPAEPDPPAEHDPRAEPDLPEQAPTAGGGLEDLAWAGVAAAAEAATLGVRLTTRAVEALRDAASRR
jgi:hypothetical protein